MEHVLTKPDPWSGLGLAAKGALVMSGTFIAIGLFTIGAALPVLQQDFASTPNAGLLVQLVGGVSAPVFALASPLAGRLVGRFGVKAVFIASLILFALAGTAPVLCTSLYQIIAARIILGLAVAGGFTAGMSGIARVPESQRHIMFGLTSFFGGGITILAYPIVGNLAAESWRFAFLVHLILLPVGLLMLALPRYQRVGHVASGHAPSSAGRLGGVPLRLLVVSVVVGWAMVSSGIYAPFYLNAMGVTDPETVGYVLSIMAVCSLAGSGSYGFVQRLVGTRGMVTLGAASALAGCTVLAIGGALPFVVAGLGLLGAGLAIFGAAGYAAAIEAIGPSGDTGAATGTVSLALYFPQILFPLAASAIGRTLGAPAVYLVLALLLAGAVVLLVLRPVPARRIASA